MKDFIAQFDIHRLFYNRLVGFVILASCTLTITAQSAGYQVEVNRVIEISLASDTRYKNPFMEAELDAIITQPDGKQVRVPGFWAGGNRWSFRYSSPQPGILSWRTECSDKKNTKLQGVTGKIDIVPYVGDNLLYRHGLIQVSGNHRKFIHSDGTPFFWLGDTWWKGLARRLSWEGFQQLATNRKEKGFSVVQIVCGPYPDEELFQASWENEGGMPYETKDFSVVNPTYFDYADRRIKIIADDGMVPAIVGGWGRPDCDAMQVGIDGLKRHWRNIIARYGAYPTIWIVGGESGGPKWTELAKYVQQIDPYHHMTTVHPISSGRSELTDESVIDFDMLQTGHGDMNGGIAAIPKLITAYSRTPVMPVMIGEYCYENHMQTGFADVQRYVFWASNLSGSGGLTYGAGGVWQASIEGDPGVKHIYDWTVWSEGMNYPGSTQLGLGKKLLEQFPWERFEPHPEWVDSTCFSAGIPGEVRFIYMPRRGVYNWSGPTVKNLEANIDWHAYYFDPITGRRFDKGIIKATAKPGDKTTEPVQFNKDAPSPQDWVLILERVKE